MNCKTNMLQKRVAYDSNNLRMDVNCKNPVIIKDNLFDSNNLRMDVNGKVVSQ